MGKMKIAKYLGSGMVLLLFCSTAFAVTAVVGTVKKIDNAAKTIVVKAADGTEHAFRYMGRTTVHGAEKVAVAAKDSYKGLKEGSEVVVHYTVKGSEETAEEIDHIGKDGLKVMEGTVSHIDRGAKTLAVKTADGTEETFRMAGHAAEDAGKDIEKGAEKSAKATVYYTEESGHKIAHFFKAAF